MSDVRRLQLVILQIAKDIDKLCRDNNIHYYLLGGSAIGAIRHKGFIPWDDDFDIVMDSANYAKFIKACKEQLDLKKYWLQEGGKDWPLEFSKLRLIGTKLEEFEGYVPENGCLGIYVDIFRMDNVSDNDLAARWQYFCGKYYLCYTLNTRSYKSASLSKRIMMALTFPLKVKFIRNWIYKQITKYNGKETKRMGLFFGRTRWHSCVVDKKIFGTPVYVPFEDTEFPVEEHYHEYLTQIFGDYMKLPPVEQRVGLHTISIDFGRY